MHATKKLCLLLLLSFCCLTASCASGGKLESGNVSQEDIHQSYTVRRTQESLEIRAKFRLKDRLGDTLALTVPSRVTHNGKEMTRQDYFMSGAGYFADEKSYPVASRFEFTDTRGKTYSNSISLDPVEFAAGSVQLKKTAQSMLPVTRIVKDDDTRVVLTIKDSSQKEYSSEVRGGRGAVGFRSSVYFDETKKAIILEPDFLKDIPEGTVTVSLVVKKEKDTLAQATGRGGEISIEYAANAIAATVAK